MGDLWFVGLGLHDEQDLSLRAWDQLGQCDPIFVEQYTSRWAPGAVQRLAQRLGRAPKEITREELEEETVVLSALAQGRTVALLVVGEPFAATTHISLRLAAEEKGHRWHVLHNASILTAAASLSGLSHYKFGRTVSVPRPSGGSRPTSPYEGLKANRDAGLHTLVLLDLDPSAGTYLTANEALRELGEVERERGQGVLPPDRQVVVVARAGSPEARVWVGAREAMEKEDFGPPLHCLIVPGPSLHFIEEDALKSWRARAETRPSSSPR